MSIVLVYIIVHPRHLLNTVTSGELYNVPRSRLIVQFSIFELFTLPPEKETGTTYIIFGGDLKINFYIYPTLRGIAIHWQIILMTDGLNAMVPYIH